MVGWMMSRLQFGYFKNMVGLKKLIIFFKQPKLKKGMLWKIFMENVLVFHVYVRYLLSKKIKLLFE